MPKKIKKSSTKHLASQILEYNNLSTDAEGKNRKHYREVVNETIEEFLSREDQADYYDLDPLRAFLPLDFSLQHMTEHGCCLVCRENTASDDTLTQRLLSTLNASIVRHDFLL